MPQGVKAECVTMPDVVCNVCECVFCMAKGLPSSTTTAREVPLQGCMWQHSVNCANVLREKREMLLESAPSAKFQSLWKFSSGGDVRLVWNPVTETTTAIFLPHKWRWPGQARKILHSEVLAVRPQRPPLWVHENCSRHRRTGLTVFCLLRLLYVFKFAQYFYYIIFFITFWHQHVEERTLHVLQHIVPVVF